jgi:hypothetical protein
LQCRCYVEPARFGPGDWQPDVHAIVRDAALRLHTAVFPAALRTQFGGCAVQDGSIMHPKECYCCRFYASLLLCLRVVAARLISHDCLTAAAAAGWGWWWWACFSAAHSARMERMCLMLRGVDVQHWGSCCPYTMRPTAGAGVTTTMNATVEETSLVRLKMKVVGTMRP